MGGGDKCLLPLAGSPILAHIIERLKPQVAELVWRSGTLLGLRPACGRRSARGLCRASSRHSCRA
jgi:hypothetical protein